MWKWAKASLWVEEGKTPYAPPALEVLMEDVAEVLFGESCCKTKTVYFYAKCNYVVRFQLREQPSSLKAIWKLHICTPYQFFLWFPACEQCERPAAKPEICLGNSSAAHQSGGLGDEGFFTFPSAWLQSHHIWKATSSTGCQSWTACWAAGEQVPRGTHRSEKSGSEWK